VDGHDRDHGHVGVGQGLVGLERDGPQGGGEGGAAVPQPPGQIQLEVAAVLFGVDHEHAAGSDGQVDASYL